MPANSSTSNKTRRDLLLDAGFGFGWLAASSLANAAPHFPPKAKRILQVFTLGGMSHMDTFDYKPELDKRDGKPQYLRHMPRVWTYLQRSLAHPSLASLRAWYVSNVPALKSI